MFWRPRPVHPGALRAWALGDAELLVAERLAHRVELQLVQHRQLRQRLEAEVRSSTTSSRSEMQHVPSLRRSHFCPPHFCTKTVGCSRIVMLPRSPTMSTASAAAICASSHASCRWRASSSCGGARVAGSCRRSRRSSASRAVKRFSSQNGIAVCRVRKYLRAGHPQQLRCQFQVVTASAMN